MADVGEHEQGSLVRPVHRVCAGVHARRHGDARGARRDADARCGYAHELFTSDQLDDIITVVADALNAKWTAGAPYLNKPEGRGRHHAHDARRRRSGAAVGFDHSFYAQTDVSGEIDNAKTNLAETLFGMAASLRAYVDFTGYPGGAHELHLRRRGHATAIEHH
jgi:hypothetical protein